MNYMGTDNMNMMTAANSGSFQPARGELTAEQRMFVRNHPNQQPNWNNNYRHGGCGKSAMRPMSGGNMNMGTDMDMSMSTGGGNMMMQPVGTVNNGMSAQMPAGVQTVSLRPETMTNTDFLPAYLNQFLGHWIRAEFYIGDAVEQRVGVLHEVGASYIIIEAIEPQTLIVCDIFSLRFVTIVLDEDYGRLIRA